jgi:hypothetical protein
LILKNNIQTISTQVQLAKLKKTKQSFDFTLSDILLNLILKNNIQTISTQVQLAKLKKTKQSFDFTGGKVATKKIHYERQILRAQRTAATSFFVHGSTCIRK